jgi:anti-sigma-K factor RskA
VSAPDPYLELAPLAALDALDGEDALAFADHVRACPACRRERDSFEDTASQIGLAVAPVTPPPLLRPRVLAAVGPRAAAAAPARRIWPLAVAATLAAAFGVGFLAMRQERDIEQQRRVHADLAHDDLLALLADTGSRATALAALPAAPRSGGHVVWNAQKRRAVLFASGLDPAPAGKAYEMWVIADGAPVPSGLFQVDGRGRVVTDLPWLDQTASAKTFAVTLEPAAGTAAPTGPMVLAGNVG